MRRNRHRTRNSVLFAALVFFAQAPLFAQASVSFPPWLQNYPGVTATVRSSNFMVESSYTASATPADIVKFYNPLFDAAGLRFQPNDDGIGTSIRAEAPECDLLIQIRSRPEGTFVKVNCSAKTQAATSSPSGINVIASRPQVTRRASATGPTPTAPAADFMQMHQQKVAEMGIHREHHDAPAPPLIWPPWLVHVNGAAVRAVAGVDQSKNAMLKAQYITNVPMTEIYSFYRELLSSHEYPTRSSMSTGQTTSGIQQNALGYVEGSNYPDGAPGAYSVIHVSFDRSVLNGPITVTLRFTTHEYIASRGY
jgi:hypothetical protein